MVSVLAYALWKTFAGWMSRSGLGDTPGSVFDKLQNIKSGGAVPPIRVVGKRVRELRLRCTTEPDAKQKLLLQRLGLTLPKRLESYLARPNCTEYS